jgi:hypothetical protein
LLPSPQGARSLAECVGQQTTILFSLPYQLSLQAESLVGWGHALCLPLQGSKTNPSVSLNAACVSMNAFWPLKKWILSEYRNLGVPFLLHHQSPHFLGIQIKTDSSPLKGKPGFANQCKLHANESTQEDLGPRDSELG